MDNKKIEKFFKRRVGDENLLLIKPKLTYNIGKYQIYLYPAEVYESGKMYHQLIITKFDESDKEISHKMFYVEEGTDIVLPKEKFEAAVKEIYSWPEHYRFDGRKRSTANDSMKINTIFMH